MLYRFNYLFKYGFFDGSQELSAKGYSGEDRMSPKQFIVMGTIFALIVIVSVLLKRAKKDRLFTVYKFLAIFMPILEVVKIAFSTYHDLKHGEHFNLGGILPLYTCSMLLYFLPFVVWGKGWIKKASEAFFVSIGMVAGLTNFIYLSAAGWYPIFTFGGLYSVVFHAVIVFVGMSLIITGQYTPSLKTIIEGMIPILIFSVFVIPANFIIKSIPGYNYVDYMQLMDANGFVPAVSDFFIEHNIQLLFSFFMLFVIYPLATAIIVLTEMGIIKFVKLFGRQADKPVFERDERKEMTEKNKNEIRTARREDWKTEPMPEKHETFVLHRSFSDDEMKALRLGNIPQAMEDKWFLYMEGSTLWAHRSWSGFCIYQIEFKEDNRHIVTVNRDPEQYLCTNLEEDIESLNELLDWWSRTPYDHYGEWLSETYDALKKTEKV